MTLRCQFQIQCSDNLKVEEEAHGVFSLGTSRYPPNPHNIPDHMVIDVEGMLGNKVFILGSHVPR